MPELVDSLTAEHLTEILSGAEGRPVSVLDATCEPLSVRGAFCDLQRIRLSYAPGAAGPATLVAKSPSLGHTRAFGEHLGLFERERMFYADLAARVPVRSPRCYHPGDGNRGNEPILLEDLSDLRAGDQVAGLSVVDADAILDGVAQLHAQYWESPELERIPDLLAYEAPVNVAMFEQACAAAIPMLEERFHDRVPAAALDGAVNLAGRFGQALQACAEGPRTLGHGDFRLDNIFFDANGAPIVVDWQSLSASRGTTDVSYLLTTGMNEDELASNWEALLRRYHKRLRESGVHDYPWPQCVEDYRQSVTFSLLPALSLLSSALTIDSEHGREYSEVVTFRVLRHGGDLGSFDTVPAR